MPSQSRGVPRPGCVFTVIHHIASQPGSSWFQSTLQATEHVWQPMHLFRSKTQASCRLACVTVPMARFSSRVSGSRPLAPADPLHVHAHRPVRGDRLPGEEPVLEMTVVAHETQVLDVTRLEVGLAPPLFVPFRLQTLLNH